MVGRTQHETSNGGAIDRSPLLSESSPEMARRKRRPSIRSKLDLKALDQKRILRSFANSTRRSKRFAMLIASRKRSWASKKPDERCERTIQLTTDLTSASVCQGNTVVGEIFVYVLGVSGRSSV
eukprot:5735638-Prymnesium_polylepis.1